MATSTTTIEYGTIVKVVNDDGDVQDFEVHFRISTQGAHGVLYSGTFVDETPDDDARVRLITYTTEEQEGAPYKLAA